MQTFQLEARACPLCGRDDAGRLFAEANVDPERLDRFAFASRKLPEYMHWRLTECRRCDLLYADPAPGPDALADLYRDAAFDSGDQARLASRSYARFLPEIARALPDQVGAADIGTGDGAFLHELIAAGFTEVRGVEPSAAPIEQADPSIRPLILKEVFRPDTFPPGSLSLVSCFQTIEHLSDVLEFCRAAFVALKPGGILFLIGHNRRAFSAKVLGRKSPIFDVEHLQLFSPASLRRLLNEAGFETVRVRPTFNAYPLNYWARLFPFPARIKPMVIDGLASSRAGGWVVPLPAGNLAAIAQKAG
ncbi:class I SAM-dependent methyltransferase [Tundrisphaera sp. TA3]|uniref:class I SAM-dependent methyltransferase n=1 Tax=Tundrisphaera sp. TA3 TaxID=3435775 RepID=UPI003EBCED1C